MKRAQDAHYEDLRLAELYDTENDWSEDNEFYLALARGPVMQILDLGCGTGALCDAYAALGHSVTGVDPASAMLEVARKKANSSRVHWVQSEAQMYSSEKRFELIVMTGHTFQVLLEETDLVAVLDVMRKHLAPGGRIAFETRNPRIDWATRWSRTQTLHLATGDIQVDRRIIKRTEERILFETAYHFPDGPHLSRSELRFWTLDGIKGLLDDSGLAIEHLYGAWDRSPFRPESSNEMIFLVKAR